MKLRHPARRLAALALCLLLLLAFLPTAHAVDFPKNATTEQDLQTAISEAAPGATTRITLLNNIEITNTLHIPSQSQTPGGDPGQEQSRTIVLTTNNGSKLFASDTFNSNGGSMISVGKNAQLMINCEIEGKASASKPYSLVSVADGASLTLDTNADLHGGNDGVIVNSAASFSMLDGSSVHNNNGTGISVNSPSSDIQISGGSIKNNGTGVHVGGNSNLKLSGGTFTSNTNDVVIGAPTMAMPDPQTPSVTIGNDSTVTANIRIDGSSTPPVPPTATQLTIEQGAMLTGDVSVGSFQINNGPQPNVQNQGTIDGNVSLGANTKLQNDGTIKGVVVTEEGASAAGNQPEGGTVSAGTPYTITATAGEHGSIDPDGEVEVPVLRDQLFTITPDPGYMIDTVLVDGEEVTVGEDSTYTLTVTKNHTITATFKPEQSQPEPEPEQPSAPDSSFTEPSYYPDYDEDAPAEEEQPEEEEAPLYMVTCRTLNVRLGGGTGYARIGTLSRGTILEGELEDGWLKFPYNGQTAYCSADYLAKIGGDLTDMHVTCRTLNVRAGAGTNFEILGTLSRGAEVEILDVLPGWYEIEHLGGEAYVSAAYIG